MKQFLARLKQLQRVILSNLLRPFCGFGIHYAIRTNGKSETTSGGLPWKMHQLQCVNCGTMIKRSVSSGPLQKCKKTLNEIVGVLCNTWYIS